LVGSIREENPYAFAMNTFNMANSLVPLVKYDERFAKAVGKWMLNASNSARLFYANSLPEYHQTDYMWAQKYDPCSCIAYEGLQKTHTECNRIVEDVETSYGRVVDGSYHDTYFTNNKYQIFEEQNIDGNDKLRHIWKANLTPSNDYKLNVVGKCDSNEAFIISCASTINGPYNPLLKIDSSSVQGLSAPVNSDSSVLFIELEDSAATNSLSKCFIDDVYIISETGSSPYITGDAKSNNWAKTNLGLYGSSFAGIFGGIISKTNVEGILKLNCSATDYFCDNACQTFLFYNPHNSEKKITLQIDNGFKHIYSVLDNTFFYKNVSGKINLVIEKDAPLLIIIIPSSCSISR
jgi:hypothetical protein